MSKAPGIFIQLKTTIIHDDKLAAAGPEATCLYVKGLCWAKEHLTDGEVRRGALAILGAGISDPEAAAQRLVDNDLWIETETGWTVGAERWARHQETKAQVDARRQADRERKQAGKKPTKKASKAPTKKAPRKRSGTPKDSRGNPDGIPLESASVRDGFQHTDTESDTDPETEPTPPRASVHGDQPAAPDGGGGDARGGFEGDLQAAKRALADLGVNRAESIALRAGSERVVLFVIAKAKAPGVKNRPGMVVDLIRAGEKPPAGWISPDEHEANRVERNRLAEEQKAADIARSQREYERDLAELALIRDHRDIAQAAAEKLARGEGFTPGVLRKKPKHEWATSKLCRAEVLDAIEEQTGKTVENSTSGRESA